MALFFNGKTGSTIYDIKSNDEICFLKDGDFKTIFENFINIYIKNNISKGTLKFNDTLNDYDYNLISQVFNIGTKFDDTNIAIFNETFGKFNEQTNFYTQYNIKNIKISSPLIKYILLIFQYLYDNITKKTKKKKEHKEKKKDEITDEIKEEQITEENITTLFNTLSTELTTTQTNLKQLNDFNTLKQEFTLKLKQYNSYNLFYRAAVYFIYKYIKFIVKQGDAIVSTLEHLKFFFLTKSGEIDNYNITEKDNNKSFTIGEECLNADKSKFNPDCVNPNIFTTEKKYIIESQPINEEKNIGNMIKFGLLPILQYLAGSETDLFKLNMKQLDATNLHTPDLLTPKAEAGEGAGEVVEEEAGAVAAPGVSTLKSLFIMFAHINTNTKDKGKESSLVCDSVNDTLEYINSISTVKKISVGGYHKKLKKYNNKNNIIQSIHIKKNYKKNKRFSSIKNVNNLYKNTLFTKRTKKNI